MERNIVRLLIVLFAFAVPAGAAPPTRTEPLLGIYVHQHWSYNHPYNARTWTLDDWQGYLDGVKRLGYNTVLIWPVLETVPEPMTPIREVYKLPAAHILTIDATSWEQKQWCYWRMEDVPTRTENPIEAIQNELETILRARCELSWGGNI